MNKILTIALLAATALAYTSCSPSEEDDIFDKSAAERLNEISDLYSSRLLAAPNGWAMQLYPTNDDQWPYGTGYLLLCKFNKDHSVSVSMNNMFSSNKFKEDTSLWEVITDNGPVLSFNSHNSCLHTFSDPYDIDFTGSSNIPNDETGEGVGGDYEFIIVDAPEDGSYMMLKGKKRGTYNLLTPIKEGTEYETYLALTTVFRLLHFPNNAPTFNVLNIRGERYKMKMKYPSTDEYNTSYISKSSFMGIPNIYPYEGDEIIDENFNPFIITDRNDKFYLRFRDKITINDELTAHDFVYDSERQVFQSVDDEETFIEGDNPGRFFKETIIEDSLEHYNWRISTTYGSEPIRNIMTSAANEFSAKKMTLGNFTFLRRDNRVTLNVSYRTSRNAQANLYFYYKVEPTENGVKFIYDGYASTEGNVLAQMPTLKQIIEGVIPQSFYVRSRLSPFDLNEIRLTSESADPEQTLILELSKNTK